jgi:transcriptional regulator with XRE-family HTH domain
MRKSDDVDFYKQIAAKLKEKRKELNLSQEKFSEILGVEFHNLQKWENTQRKIPLDKLVKLCQIFNVQLDYFVSSPVKSKKSAQLSNPELEKEIMMLKEIYNYGDENFIYMAKNNIELAYGLIKKERRVRKNARDPKKKMA